MRKADLTDTGTVLCFSFVELWKLKANRITVAVLLIAALLVYPVVCVLQDGGESEEDGPAEDTFSAALENAGFSEEQARLLSLSAYGTWDYADDLSELETESEDDSELQMYFSIVLMSVTIFASSFIISSVAEEKTSKLVELLMVSVRTPALLLGKVLGNVLYVVSLMGSLAGALLLADGAVRLFGVQSILNAWLKTNAAGFSIGADTLTVGIITVVLGILVLSLLSCLCGAGCSSMDDVSNALGLPMVLIMAAYIVSAFLPLLLEDTELFQSVCLIPVLSSFLVPVQYAAGTIGLATAAGSWVLMLAAGGVLVLVSARVYADLLIYRGKRLKLGSIFRMAFRRGKEAA